MKHVEKLFNVLDDYIDREITLRVNAEVSKLNWEMMIPIMGDEADVLKEKICEKLREGISEQVLAEVAIQIIYGNKCI